MRRNQILKTVLTAAILVAVIVGALIASDGGEAGGFRESAWALLPPVIAIALALVTKEVYSSLLIGIVFGGLLYSDFRTTIGSLLTMTTLPARTSCAVFIKIGKKWIEQ